jgi:hypothetical protein
LSHSLSTIISLSLPSANVTFLIAQIASEPRKILETRKRFLDCKFTAAQKAEADVQRLLNALLQASSSDSGSVRSDIRLRCFFASSAFAFGSNP